MSKNKQNGKQLSHLERALKQSEKKNEELEKQLSKSQEALQTAIEEECLERVLKNEAYAFLLAEGLVDKFLEFREYFHRTKAQNALYNLVAEAHQGGLWIDL
jgi:hypothetical protein